jgi:hypothetical protein
MKQKIRIQDIKPKKMQFSISCDRVGSTEQTHQLCLALLEAGYCVELKEPNHIGCCGIWNIYTWRE